MIGVILAANGIIIALLEMLLVFKLEGRKPYLWFISTGTLLMALAFLMLNIPLSNGLCWLCWQYSCLP